MLTSRDPLGSALECGAALRPTAGRALLASTLVGCALWVSGCRSVPDASEVLSSARGGSERDGSADPTRHESRGADDPQLAAPLDLLAASQAAVAASEQAALALLERARAAEPADTTASDGSRVALFVEASRALCDVADLRMQTALVARFHDALTTDPGQLVRGEDELSDTFRRELEGLLREAATLARRALEREPEHPEARQLEAFAESLSAWAMGPTRALLAGAGRRLPKLLAANRALGPLRADAAPTRLEGRFLCMAPWPAGDLARGRALLDEAAAHAPTALTSLFQGDAAWLAEDSEAASFAWRTAADVGARASVTSDTNTALIGALARLRLVALERVSASERR